MNLQRGIADFTLDYGQCPKWLFERMVKLGREIIRIIVEGYGPDEFVKRMGDPVWFQSLGTLLAFDWNASGLTTTLTAALKESIRGREKDWGIFICGGKGKTSRKTPQEINQWGEKINLPITQTQNLIHNSKMSAKVDNSLVQDGFQIYHHSFIFSSSGAWTVVQQGMNTQEQTARRYHWHSETIEDIICEPHSGISSETIRPSVLNLTSRKSDKNRQVSLELAQGNYYSLLKDLQILRKHSSSLVKVLSLKDKKENQLTLLKLEDKEFHTHPVIRENFFQSKYLEKILAKVVYFSPKSYQELLSIEGVGPKTIRALALISEVIYGAKPSYEDPARYSFAHGGKDRIPFPVNKPVYDKSIEILRKAVLKSNIPASEKKQLLQKTLTMLK